jgi:hypothetical protein
MKRSVKPIVIVGCGAIVAIAVMIWLHAMRARRGADREIAGIEAANSTLAPVLASAETRLAKAERRRLETENALQAREKAKASSGNITKPLPPPTITLAEVIAQSPALEVLELNRQRWAFRIDFEHLFSLLGLTGEQAAKLEQIHAAYTERSMDLSTAERAQDDPGRQTLAKLQAEAKAGHESALQDLLGADRYRRMQEYERRIPLRNSVVRPFAGAAALEGMPITAEQGERMVDALVAAGGDDVSGSRQDLAGIDWDSFEGKVSRILSPAQLHLFRSVSPDTGFGSRWDARLKAEIRRAFDAEAASKPESKAEVSRR